MKRKFSRILGVVAVIALLASFMVPVSADVSQPSVILDDFDVDNAEAEISAINLYTITFDVNEEVVPYVLERGSAGGSAEWSATEKRSGTYSIHLSDGGTGYDTDPDYYGRVVIPDVNLPLANLLTAGDLSYYFNYFDDPGTGYPDAFPYMILAIDSGGGTVVDAWIVLHSGGDSYQPAQNTWVKWDISAWDSWLGAGAASGTYKTLSQFSTDHASADVVDVKVAVGEWHTGTYTPITGYVDDIHIEGTTYDIEPGIVVEFPEGTEVDDDWINDDVEVRSTAGFGDANTSTPVGVDVTTLEEDDIYTVAIGLGQLPYNIGEGARVRVNFLDDQITNPDTAGDFTLWVSTSAEDEPVESETYEIEVPEIGVLPGVVEVYNPSDVLMASYTGDDAIDDAIGKADEDWTILIGEGLYDWDLTTTAADVTIEGSGDVEDIIVEGTWTISHTDITIDGITLDGDEGAISVLLDVNFNDFTIQNCILQYAGTALITDSGSEADHPTTIEDCTFNIEDEIGIDANADDAEITDCTFNIEEDGDGVGIDINADIEVTDCTFNGGSGVGVEVSGSTTIDGSAIEGCTFDGLLTAFVIDAGTVDIFGGTIQNCEEEAITVAAATLVTIHNNTITGNDEAVILLVDDDAEFVFMMFNDITDNAGDDDLLIDNTTGDDLFVSNNWWGDPDGPEQGDDAFSDDVESEPFLPGPIENSAIETAVAFGDAADFEDVCGVTVESTDGSGAMDIVGAAQYTENPVAAIDDAVAFWDVAVIDPAALVTEITIRLYTDVTDNTEVWVWGEARGEWLESDVATPNLFGGFMSIAVTDDSTPTIGDLEALPFVVVDPGEGTEEAVDITAPEIGATDVSVTPTLAWEAIEDATYEIQIAQDATFAILDEAATSPTNAYIVTTALAEGQSYYWRVRAVTDAGAGKWATGVFTTATPEPEPEPPIEVVEVGPPEITVTMPPATITQAIDPGLLWAIIGVGAVLVISLIVLIVRTRRAV